VNNRFAFVLTKSKNIIVLHLRRRMRHLIRACKFKVFHISTNLQRESMPPFPMGEANGILLL